MPHGETAVFLPFPVMFIVAQYLPDLRKPNLLVIRRSLSGEFNSCPGRVA